MTAALLVVALALALPSPVVVQVVALLAQEVVLVLLQVEVAAARHARQVAIRIVQIVADKLVEASVWLHVIIVVLVM